jgi:hypothetical protein
MVCVWWGTGSAAPTSVRALRVKDRSMDATWRTHRGVGMGDKARAPHGHRSGCSRDPHAPTLVGGGGGEKPLQHPHV